MRRSILFASSIVLVPSLAFAAGGGSAGIGSLAYPAINFTLFALLIVYLYKGKVAPILRQRSIEIRDKLGQAAQRLSGAEKQLDLLHARLNEIGREREDLLRRYAEEGETISHAIVEQAKQSAVRMGQDVERQVDAEINQAKRQLRAGAVSKAVALARQKLGAQLQPDQDRQLRRQVLEQALTQVKG